MMLSFLNTDSDSRVTKYQSNSRWQAHAKAVSAINASCKSIINGLSHINIDENVKRDTRLQAGTLLEKNGRTGVYLMLNLWTRLLEEFHKTIKALQGSTDYTYHMYESVHITFPLCGKYSRKMLMIFNKKLDINCLM